MILCHLPLHAPLHAQPILWCVYVLSHHEQPPSTCCGTSACYGCVDMPKKELLLLISKLEPSGRCPSQHAQQMATPTGGMDTATHEQWYLPSRFRAAFQDMLTQCEHARCMHTLPALPLSVLLTQLSLPGLVAGPLLEHTTSPDPPHHPQLHSPVC